MIVGRLFTFGCSFTQYDWPTWADILAREFDQFENWGKLGAGNHFIFNSLIECHIRNIISAEDTVAIMWTSIGREDRWVRGRGWVTPGSIYNQFEYDNSFVKKWADPTGYLIRDLAFVSAARQILDSIGCRYYFFSIVPFEYYDDSQDPDQTFSLDKRVVALYNKDISWIKPSVYEVVFNRDWYSRPGEVSVPALQDKYQALKGADWPQWEDYWAGKLNGIKDNIIEEIKRLFARDLVRTNDHPTPAEHLFYLHSVVPELKISSDTVSWCEQANTAVLKGEKFNWNRHLPNRL